MRGASLSMSELLNDLFGELRELLQRPVSLEPLSDCSSLDALLVKAQSADKDAFLEQWLPYLHRHHTHCQALAIQRLTAILTLKPKAMREALEPLWICGQSAVQLAAARVYQTPRAKDSHKKLALELLATDRGPIHAAHPEVLGWLSSLLVSTADANRQVARDAIARIVGFAEQAQAPLDELVRSHELTEKDVALLLDGLHTSLPHDAAHNALFHSGVHHWSVEGRARAAAILAERGEATPPDSRWAACPASDRIKRALLKANIGVLNAPRVGSYIKTTPEEATRCIGAWLEHYAAWPGGIWRTSGLTRYKHSYVFSVHDFRRDYGDHPDGTPKLYASFAALSNYCSAGIDLRDPSSDPAVVMLEEDASFSYQITDRLSTFLSKCILSPYDQGRDMYTS